MPESTHTTPATDPIKLWILLDRSGSMASFGDAPITATNEFLDKQRQGEGECRFSLVLFDTEAPFEVAVDDQSIESVEPLTDRVYWPRGGTPLYDALGRLISRADRRLVERRDGGFADEDQVVVVYTDGWENSSREYTQPAIVKLIEERSEQGWEFVFLGANIDAYEAGGQIGVAAGNTAQFDATPDGFAAAQESTSDALLSRRAMTREQRAESRGSFFKQPRKPRRRKQSSKK